MNEKLGWTIKEMQQSAQLLLQGKLNDVNFAERLQEIKTTVTPLPKNEKNYEVEWDFS